MVKNDTRIAKILKHVSDREIADRFCRIKGRNYFSTRKYIIDPDTGVTTTMYAINKFIEKSKQ
jgi:hypothetical protein